MSEKESYLDPRDKVVITCVVTVALLLVLLALCLVGMHAIDQDTKREQACVAAHGSWVGSECVVSH